MYFFLEKKIKIQLTKGFFIRKEIILWLMIQIIYFFSFVELTNKSLNKNSENVMHCILTLHIKRIKIPVREIHKYIFQKTFVVFYGPWKLWSFLLLGYHWKVRYGSLGYKTRLKKLVVRNHHTNYNHNHIR